MTRTFAQAMHDISVLAVHLFGIMASISIVYTYLLGDFNRHPIVSFTGLAVTLVFFGISVGSECLAICLERDKTPRRELSDPLR